MTGSTLVMGTKYQKVVENMRCSVAKTLDLYMSYMQYEQFFVLMMFSCL